MDEEWRRKQQLRIEAALHLTKEDGDFIQENQDLFEVKAFTNLYSIQVSAYDPMGFALLQSALDDVRIAMQELKEKEANLVPPDLDQCQAMKPNGYNFMTLGGVPGMIRCSNLPTWIATENNPGEDGLKGSMALCNECRAKLLSQLGEDHATLTRIEGR